MFGLCIHFFWMDSWMESPSHAGANNSTGQSLLWNGFAIQYHPSRSDDTNHGTRWQTKLGNSPWQQHQPQPKAPTTTTWCGVTQSSAKLNSQMVFTNLMSFLLPNLLVLIDIITPVSLCHPVYMLVWNSSSFATFTPFEILSSSPLLCETLVLQFHPCRHFSCCIRPKFCTFLLMMLSIMSSFFHKFVWKTNFFFTGGDLLWR